jgi:hypothetical protein
MSTLLYGVKANELVSLCVVTAILTVVATAAPWLPAWRAATVDFHGDAKEQSSILWGFATKERKNTDANPRY